MTNAAITIDLDDYNATCYQGNPVELILDPIDNSIGNVCHIGGGCSSAVWDRRELAILTYAHDVVASEVETWVQQHDALIQAILACYESTEWAKCDLIGKWSDGVEDALHALQSAFDDAQIAQYWDASDYLAGDPQTAIKDVLAIDDIAKAAKHEVSVALDNNCYIEQDDTETALRNLLDGEQVDLEDDDPRGIAIRKLLDA